MNLYNTLDIASTGLAAQRKRVEILAENIANAETTRTPDGGPYQRRRVVFEGRPPREGFQIALRDAQASGVRVAEVVTDPAPPERRYLPEHPDADAEGYVAFPSFNPVEDMVDLTAAVRGYQANLAVAGAVRDMINRTIEVARG
ncbi:MAG: flagellar basal body rod protein FlgC [Bryobacterales bacterium]|nr:flagellar basal body rod protein FlgC [Bryobacterales bacterium]